VDMAAPSSARRALPWSGPVPRSGEQVRSGESRTVGLEHLLENLPVRQAAVDLLADVLAHRIGHSAAVGVAACQRVEHASATVALDRARAVDTRQEPLDAL